MQIRRPTTDAADPPGPPGDAVHPRAEPEHLLGRRPDPVRLAVLGLFGLAVMYTLYVARPVILPVVLAALLALVLDPIVCSLGRLKISRPIATGIVMIALLAAVVLGVSRLAEPAGDWLSEAPRNFRELEQKLAGLKKPMEEVERATEEVQRMLGDSTEATEVRVQEASFAEAALDRARGWMSEGLVTFVLLSFLLASGDLFLRKTVRVMPTLEAKKTVVTVVRHVKDEISKYLLTMGAINVGLGTFVALAMWLVDMPNPVLWGVLAGLLNFVPYLGPLIGVLIVAVASLLTFDSLGRGALAPLLYLALNTLEGSVVTPAILGRRLSLNPIVVLVSLLLWGWLWGIPGALMAVPLAVTIKIVSDHYAPLSAFGEMLGPT